MRTPLSTTIAHHRAQVEDVFGRLCAELFDACSGVPYGNQAAIAPEPRGVAWHVEDKANLPTIGHAFLAREAAERKALQLYDELLALFPKVPAYATAPWAKPGIAVKPSYTQLVALDVQPTEPTRRRSTPLFGRLEDTGRVLSAIWAIPLLWPKPSKDAGTWELSFYEMNQTYKPCFWAPNGAAAQIIGAMLWESHTFDAWVSGKPLSIKVRRLPETPPSTDHLRALFK